jgi:uncharacterized surface protein with fasciclin (FAS1) repeats
VEPFIGSPRFFSEQQKGLVMARSIRCQALPAFAFLSLAATATPSLAASVGDIITADPRFSALTDYIMRGNMLSTLKGSTQLTVFAPVNDAFNKAPTVGVLQRSGAAQMPNLTGMTDLVREHVVAGAHPPAEFIGQRVLIADASGTTLVVDGSAAGAITVQTQPSVAFGTNSTGTGFNAQRVATVIGQPIMADNGVIYPIDNVLLQ